MAATCFGQTGTNNSDAQSICGLFKDLRSNAGKIVTVRGFLYTSDEVFALGGRGRCESKFVTTYSAFPTLPNGLEFNAEFVWPDAIHFAMSKSVESGHFVDYETDNKSISYVMNYITQERTRMQSLEKSQAGKSREIDVLVTVTGMLQMKDHYNAGPIGNGTIRGDGYGHLKVYPAQLLINKMFDPKVEWRIPEQGTKR